MRAEVKVAAISGAVILLLLATGPAQSLASSNTVWSDDIVNGQVRAADIALNAVNGARIIDGTVTGVDVQNGSLTGVDVKDGSIGSADVANNSLTGADINESTLAMPGPKVRFARIFWNVATQRLERRSGHASSVERPGVGFYSVNFPFDLDRCAVTATAELRLAIASVERVAPRTLFVYIDSAQGGVYDASFNLTLTCP